jgi:hypothetical protein
MNMKLQPGPYTATKGEKVRSGSILTKEEALHVCGFGEEGLFNDDQEIDRCDQMIDSGWIFTRRELACSRCGSTSAILVNPAEGLYYHKCGQE